MINPVVDINGFVRRLGSLENPPGLVSSVPTFASDVVPYDDADIRKLLLDSNRVPARRTFGEHWIVNQKQYASCNGWLWAQMLHKSRWLRGIQDGLILSGAYAYSLINGGQDNGSVLEHGAKKIEVEGLPPASLVTADMIYPNLQPKNAREEALKHRGFNVMRCDTMQEVRTALAMQRPVGVVVTAGRGYQTLDRWGVCGIDSGRGNHAILLDDLAFIGGKEVADHGGSWGLDYGDRTQGFRGRGYIDLEALKQTMPYHYFYTIGSTVES